ncbi:kinase-like protein [Gigaspora margarita]|uniref:Kinase-like protein n=1 Tax=Gigaspora margarita TaxID=4874 RepID=A0A8H4AF68_GIGMA|nr:kinase-like protein [Gigaspora margarita]
MDLKNFILKTSYEKNIMLYSRQWLKNRQKIGEDLEIILKYANYGDLRNYYLQTNLSWSNKVTIAKEIINGINYLHNNEIIHRDLHTKNILLDNGIIKITDFGLAKQINNHNSISYLGMPGFVDPECMITRDKKSDIFSYRVILWEIANEKIPQGGVKLENNNLSIPNEYKQISSMCLDSRNQRPDGNYIYNFLNTYEACGY